jgi:hypothetical protein
MSKGMSGDHKIDNIPLSVPEEVPRNHQTIQVLDRALNEVTLLGIPVTWNVTRVAKRVT